MVWYVCMYIYTYIHTHTYIYMIDMIVYAFYTHLKTPLTRPHRVSGVDALPKTLITWLEYTEPVLLSACFSHPRSTFMHPGILATQICLHKLTPGGFWRSWQVKLQGLEDENLNGKVGVLRSLVASTGKFAIELDGDDARVQFNCIRVTLVKTSWQHIQIFTLSLQNAFLAQTISRHVAMPSGCKDGTVQVKPSNILKV